MKINYIYNFFLSTDKSFLFNSCYSLLFLSHVIASTEFSFQYSYTGVL